MRITKMSVWRETLWIWTSTMIHPRICFVFGPVHLPHFHYPFDFPPPQIELSVFLSSRNLIESSPSFCSRDHSILSIDYFSYLHFLPLPSRRAFRYICLYCNIPCTKPDPVFTLCPTCPRRTRDPRDLSQRGRNMHHQADKIKRKTRILQPRLFDLTLSSLGRPRKPALASCGWNSYQDRRKSHRWSPDTAPFRDKAPSQSSFPSVFNRTVCCCGPFDRPSSPLSTSRVDGLQCHIHQITRISLHPRVRPSGLWEVKMPLLHPGGRTPPPPFDMQTRDPSYCTAPKVIGTLGTGRSKLKG